MFLCGEVVIRRNRSRVSRKVLFFHVYAGLTQNESSKNRNMYCFNTNILKYSECIHAGLNGSLSGDKAELLVKEGGIIYEYHQHKVFVKSLFRRLFVDYFKSFLGSFHHLSFNKLSSFSVMKGFASTVYNTIKIESYLEGVNARLVYFEIEYGVFPGLFTILANKKGTKTMSMAHGYSAYCLYDYGRTNMVLNYFLVPGNYYDRYLLRYNPHIDKCCPVGNHEIDNICIEGKGDIENIKQKGKKTVGILIGFAAIYFPERQRHPRQPLYDEALAKRAFMEDWMPFFEWAGRQNDILFVFKGKGGQKQYEHRYLKEALSKIPKENYYQNDDILMSNVISACDCLISSGNSSALFSSLCIGIPTICYDTFMKGYVAVEEYSDYLVARSPDELISKIRYLLENGLPDNVYESVLNDHYAEGRFDGKTSFRIKKLITEILEVSHTHSING